MSFIHRDVIEVALKIKDVDGTAASIEGDLRLWSDPRVLVTPHISSVNDCPGAIDVFCESLPAYVDGRPLQNVIDWTRGYLNERRELWPTSAQLTTHVRDLARHKGMSNWSHASSSRDSGVRTRILKIRDQRLARELTVARENLPDCAAEIV